MTVELARTLVSPSGVLLDLGLTEYRRKTLAVPFPNNYASLRRPSDDL